MARYEKSSTHLCKKYPSISPDNFGLYLYTLRGNLNVFLEALVLISERSKSQNVQNVQSSYIANLSVYENIGNVNVLEPFSKTGGKKKFYPRLCFDLLPEYL